MSVLQLAPQLRLIRVGTASVEGTKRQANASKHAAVSDQRAGEMIEQLELEVQDLMVRAEQAEAKESQETLDIPAELMRREQRKAARQQARPIIEERGQEMAAARQADDQAKQAARPARREAGKKPRGPEPEPPSPTPDPQAPYHFTDPESRIIESGQREPFRAVLQRAGGGGRSDVDRWGAGERGPNDKQELAPTVQAISPVVLEAVHAVLVDSGFYSEAAVQAVEQKPDGAVTGVPVYAAVEKHSHHQTVADLRPPNRNRRHRDRQPAPKSSWRIA